MGLICINTSADNRQAENYMWRANVHLTERERERAKLFSPSFRSGPLPGSGKLLKYRNNTYPRNGSLFAIKTLHVNSGRASMPARPAASRAIDTSLKRGSFGGSSHGLKPPLVELVPLSPSHPNSIQCSERPFCLSSRIPR